ncbi:MAG: hypothetical protein R3B99_26010 [Polyangiales bacterium]
MSAKDSIAKLEVSRLSAAAFAQLGVKTIGELCERTQLELLDAAYAKARDDERVAPVLAEVLAILADRGLTLPRGDGPSRPTLPRDGAEREGWTYLGTTRCRSAWIVGERRFVGREGTLGRVRVDARPGLYDVYERGGYRAKELELVARDGGPEVEVRREPLTMPEPLVVVANADAQSEMRAWSRANAKGVVADGVAAVLAFGAIELVASAADATSPVTRLRFVVA